MDREKIIKELHDARRYLEDKEWSDKGASPHIDAINNVLALLKEQYEEIENLRQTAQSMMEGICLLKMQEAVKPMKQIEENEWTVCGCCKNHLVSKWAFCPNCGKPILWEGR